MDFHLGTGLSHSELLKSIGCEVRRISLNDWRQMVHAKKLRRYRGLRRKFIKLVEQAIIILARRQLKQHPILLRPELLLCLVWLLPYSFEHKLSLIFNAVIKPHAKLKEYTLFIARMMRYRYVRDYFDQFDYLMCSYPPSMFQILEVIAQRLNQKIILNIGHRFNVWIHTKEENEQIKKDLLRIAHDSKYIVGAASVYDDYYTKHYLDLTLHPLYLKAFQVHAQKKKLKDANNTILLRLFANYSGSKLSKSLGYNSAYFNKQYHLFCQQHDIATTLNFKTLQEEFPVPYQLDDMKNYRGVIVLPYSAFSITGIELYELNIPFFYPSKEFLIESRGADDYAIHPVYCSTQQYRQMEHDVDDEESPNSYNKKAQQKWMTHFYGYQQKNSIIFNDIHDLFTKIHLSEQNYDKISVAMWQENQQERKLLQKRWRQLLNIS